MPEYWEKETSTHIFFYGGPFSNWFKCHFFSNFKADGKLIEFNCSEQYMMAAKANLFKDLEIYNLIMKCRDPASQKALGKAVKGFSDEVWLPAARSIVYNGCYDKFFQNDRLFSILMSTGDKILVEGSPTDKLWGVGYHAEDYRITNLNRWTGKNWLGQVLMKVRLDLSNSHNDCFEEIEWDKI